MKKIIQVFIVAFSFISLSDGAKKNNFLPNSFQAKFVQEYKSSLSGKIKKSKGKLDYRFPGSIRFETNFPDEIIFVSNPATTWYYTAPFIEGEPGELTKRSTSKNVLSKFFDSLRKGLKNNSLYNVKVKKESAHLTFSKEAKKDLGIKTAILIFKTTTQFKDLKNIEISYTDKKNVKLTLSEVEVGKKFSKKHFIFTPPKNTRVNR